MTHLVTFVLLCLCTSVSIVSARKDILQFLEELWDINYNILNGASITKRESRDDMVLEIHRGDSNDWCFCGDKSWADAFTDKNREIVDKCYNDKQLPLLSSNIPSISTLWFGEITNLKIDTCSVNCIFREKKWINSEGKLDKVSIKKYLIDNIFKEDWMRNMAADKVVDKCLNNNGDFSDLENFILSGAHNISCNVKPLKFTLCLTMEMTDNCPDDKLNQGFICQLHYLVLDMTKNFISRN